MNLVVVIKGPLFAGLLLCLIACDGVRDEDHDPSVPGGPDEDIRGGESDESDLEIIQRKAVEISGGLPGCVRFSDGVVECWVHLEPIQPHEVLSVTEEFWIPGPGADFSDRITRFRLKERFVSIDVHETYFCGMELFETEQFGGIAGDVICGELVDRGSTAFLRERLRGSGFTDGITVGPSLACATPGEIRAGPFVCSPFVSYGDRGLILEQNLLDLPSNLDVVRDLSFGSGVACATRFHQPAICWGRDVSDGGIVDSISDVEGIQLVQVSVGEWHACGLDEKNRIHCWGRGTNGDLDVQNRDFGQAYPPLQYARLVTSGRYHSCAIDLDDGVHCWGWLDGRVEDEEGDEENTWPWPTSSARSMAEGIFAEGPTRTGRFRDLSTSGSISCTLSWENVVNCWGERWFDISF